MSTRSPTEKYHKYKLNQYVRLVRPGFSDKLATVSSDYEITRLLPADQTGEFTYRIKATGFSERAVRESEIVARAMIH